MADLEIPPVVPAKSSPIIRERTNYFEATSYTTPIRARQDEIDKLQEAGYVVALKSHEYFPLVSSLGKMPHRSTKSLVGSASPNVAALRERWLDDFETIPSDEHEVLAREVAAPFETNVPVEVAETSFASEKHDEVRGVVEVGTNRSQCDSVRDIMSIYDGISEMDFSLSYLNTVLFEIQELRHTTANYSSPHRPSNSIESPVDLALARMQDRLNATHLEYSILDAEVSSLIYSAAAMNTLTISHAELELLRRKWSESTRCWEDVQVDAEVLGDELKEDKYVVVFRTVAGQATDMMESLEKVMRQSRRFIDDIKAWRAMSPKATADSIATYRSDFETLRSSLTAKIKHYSPACERVLKVLGKGIAGRTTRNGEVLRSYGDMNGRWNRLTEAMEKVEDEMDEVEELLLRQQSRAPSSSVLKKTKRFSTIPILSSSYNSTSNRSPGQVSLGSSTTAPSMSYLSVSLPPSSAYPYLAALPPTSHYAHSSPAKRAKSPMPVSQRPPWNGSSKHVGGAIQKGESTIEQYLRTSTSGDYGTSSGRMSALGMRSASRASISRSANDAEARGVYRPPSPTVSVYSERSTATTTTSRYRIATGAAPRTSSSSSSKLRTNTRGHSYTPRMHRDYSTLDIPPVPPLTLLLPTPRVAPSTPTHRSLSKSTSSATPSTAAPTATATSRSRLPRRSSALPSHDPNFRAHQQQQQQHSPPLPSTPSAASTSSMSLVSRHDQRSYTPEARIAARLCRSARPSTPPPLPALPRSSRHSLGARVPSLASSSMSQQRGSSVAATPPSRLAEEQNRNRNRHEHEHEHEHEDYQYQYIPNPLDALDVAIARIVFSLPAPLFVERIDEPLTRSTANAMAENEVRPARYSFNAVVATASGVRDRTTSRAKKSIMCKLVERVGGRGAGNGEKKTVLVRIPVGWKDLENYAMGLINDAWSR